jgi:hypothetical protein
MASLKVAYEKAKAEQSYEDDQTRFKVFEMHLLSQLQHQFGAIQYASGAGSVWFDFPKAIRNNILVELNINALGEIFSLDSQILKDVIGSLNWKKFAERIKTQLQENLLLTKTQQNLMKLNGVICLIKSNNLEEAGEQLMTMKSDEAFREEEEYVEIIKDLEVFMLIKAKKYQQALQMVTTQQTSNVQDVLLAAQLDLYLKNNHSAVLRLVHFLLTASSLSP